MTSVIKPPAGLDRIKLAEAVPLDTPLSIFIFPTTYCNFKCVYCGHSLGYEQMKTQYGFIPESMSLGTFREVVAQLQEFPGVIEKVSLTGHGEPLLNPDIAEMVHIVKQSQVSKKVEIITNASLLTAALARKLVESGLDCLRVSIQGITTEKYKSLCQSNITFEEIYNNLAYFSAIKGNCRLYVKVMDVALDCVKDQQTFYRMFQDITDRMFIESCRPVYDGVAYTENMNTTSDRYGREHEHREVCPLPFFMLSIFPNGDVEPCDTIYRPVILGNIHEQTLSEMWNGDDLREFRMMQLNKMRHLDKNCGVCCAPDDVSHPEDILDEACDLIKARL